MFKSSLVPALAAAFALAGLVPAAAQSMASPAPSASIMAQPSGPPASPMMQASSMPAGGPMGGDSMGGDSMKGSSMKGSSMKGSSMMGAMEHGMPVGKMGADGAAYTGVPDLQAAVSLVTAGGAIGHFSISTALVALAGPSIAHAESAKLAKQYGATNFKSFVTVQNFAVNDAVRIASNAGVKFPTPTLHGHVLATRVVTLGLQDGAYYEGVQLDHLVTHKIHEAVMADIDQKYGKAADANYHRIADQAHYDLAQALGATSVKLAAYH